MNPVELYRKLKEFWEAIRIFARIFAYPGEWY